MQSVQFEMYSVSNRKCPEGIFRFSDRIFRVTSRQVVAAGKLSNAGCPYTRPFKLKILSMNTGYIMKTLLLVMALILVSGAAFGLLGGCSSQPLQGMTTDAATGLPVLLSRARPAMSFAPADDMRFRSAGWRSLQPKTRTSQKGDARIWFVIYDKGQGTLITALAEAADPWEWEAAHHAAFSPLRELQYEQHGEMLHESLFCLTSDQDPFCAHEGAEACLVYRAKFLLNFRKMQVIVEYHEPLEAARIRDIAFQEPVLNAFQERGRAACAIYFLDKAASGEAAKDFQPLSQADARYSRSMLSRWTGELQQSGGRL